MCKRPYRLALGKAWNAKRSGRKDIVLALFAGGALLSGCAVNYYDAKTGTEHLWGWGHLKMKVNPPITNVLSTVAAKQTFGVNVGLGREDYYLSAGWDNRRLISVSQDASVALEWPKLSWPSDRFFSVRIGTNLPPTWLSHIDPLGTNND